MAVDDQLNAPIMVQNLNLPKWEGEQGLAMQAQLDANLKHLQNSSLVGQSAAASLWNSPQNNEIRSEGNNLSYFLKESSNPKIFPKLFSSTPNTYSDFKLGEH